MMQEQEKNVVSRNIFGPYIQNMRVIPGREQTNKSKEQEKYSFEIIDEYIEEA